MNAAIAVGYWCQVPTTLQNIRKLNRWIDRLEVSDNRSDRLKFGVRRWSPMQNERMQSMLAWADRGSDPMLTK